jgi:hypothetical protein
MCAACCASPQADAQSTAEIQVPYHEWPIWQVYRRRRLFRAELSGGERLGMEGENLATAYEGSGRANLAASGYRLPAETEWEYAAAKGAPGQVERLFPWGDDWNPKN